jgi:predicted nucleic acid-binding protein
VIVLDTSYLLDFFKREDLATVLPEREKAVVTVVTYYEIMAGIRRLKSYREEKFFRHFFSDIEVLELTVPSAEIASDIAGRMAAAGSSVNAFDILIAGIALSSHASAIVTADSDFKEIAKFARIDILEYAR